MPVNDGLLLVAAALAGVALGVVFFGGLWLTVRAVPQSSHPFALVMLSFWGRSALVVAGFYLVAGGDWRRLMVSLVGFIAARMVQVRRWRPTDAAAVSTEE